MKKLFFTIIIAIFTGCSSSYQPLPTVEKVDLNRYLGTWYEIARYEHFFERGCSNVSATYSLQEKDKIKVHNRCEKDGKIKDAKGVAYATDESFSKLKVSFFRPFYGDYQILMISDDYSYAVIGEPTREYFWVLSRTKTLEKEILSMILEKMPSLGYDEKLLIWTPQD